MLANLKLLNIKPACMEEQVMLAQLYLWTNAITNSVHSLRHSLKCVQAVMLRCTIKHNTEIIVLVAAHQTPYWMRIYSTVQGLTSKNILQQTFRAYMSSKIAVEHKSCINVVVFGENKHVIVFG